MDLTEFEWDIEKARTNLAKHGVSFEEACLAVLDPHRVEIIDDRFDYDEERLRIIGLSSQRILLVVTVSHAQDHHRIISARPASRREESYYFRGES
ncbi:BrnT family toxin [Caulobacter sp. BK020]|uniref:BrnT family toxin n=1 Tax=Caulobacter sp. BK020 TaxID=2512117 RepID=UPI00104D5306|nr:BrnT family toxin [Caulobacter sp. BK020]TCS16808.1 hypothetical protein EV278_103314 [Caulobacter sp. BK020]